MASATQSQQRYRSLPQREEAEEEDKGNDDTNDLMAASDGEDEEDGEEAGLLGLGLIKLGGASGLASGGGGATRAAAGVPFPGSSPASAGSTSYTNTTAGLSPMTFMSLADSTFTPLSMTSNASNASTASNHSDLYIGDFVDEDLDCNINKYDGGNEKDQDEAEQDDNGAQSPSHRKSQSQSKKNIIAYTTAISEDQQQQQQRHYRLPASAKWSRRRRSLLLKSPSAIGPGGGNSNSNSSIGIIRGGGGASQSAGVNATTATAPGDKMATQSLHPPMPTRARAAATEEKEPGTETGIASRLEGKGYGLLSQENSPTPESDSDNNININKDLDDHSEKRLLNRRSSNPRPPPHHDANDITPSSSVSPAAVGSSLSPVSGAAIKDGDGEEDDEKSQSDSISHSAARGRSTRTSNSTSHTHNTHEHEESEERTQTQLQDSLGLARHHHIAETSTNPNPNTIRPSKSTNKPLPPSFSAPEIIRPKFVRKSQPPSVASPTSSQFSSSSSPPLPHQGSSASYSPVQSRRHSPAIIRTASVSSVLRHPVPDLNTRSGAYTGNIAALEATAERLSMTSSIEDAIRSAHDELKRSDSRRSSILAAASVRRASGEHIIEGLDKILPQPSIRQSSILELNNAARLGGYSPAGFVMSPNHSLSSRLRSGSKGSAGPLSRHSSTKSRAGETVEGDAFPFLSRAGPGKGSVHSIHSVHSVHSARSAQLSLAEIAEMEPPTSLTQEAMETADSAARGGPYVDDEETIRINAYQHVEPGATDIEVDMDLTPNADTEASQPMLDHALDSYWNDDPSPPQLQLRNPEDPISYRDEYQPPAEKRPASAGSHGTYEQVNAFEDFDGVHCDPDTVAEQFPFHREEAQVPPPVQRQSRPISQMPPRPKSYFDAETGQQMLFYPARVPAMLNLPRKLGKGPRAPARNVRRSQVLSAMPEASRESRVWLPDPLEGQMGSPLIDERLSTSSRGPASGSVEQFPQMPEPAVQDLPSPDMQDQQAPELQHLRRPAKLTDADRRKSRMSAMPDQLRASAFFDLPSAPPPKIEIKDGSAMATLDSILDAAASAPVSAFTDHAYAGKLGSEVYGPVKQKKNRQSQMPGAMGADKGHKARASTATALGVHEVEKRKSMWSLLPGRRVSDAATVEGGRSTVMLVDEERQRLSGDRSPLSEGGAALTPGEDEAGSGSSDEEEEDEEAYQGAPTTLLAELQLRKQQQKMRTRPVHKAFPNGMHSTLLELDAVAQVEAKQRRGKKVNLAWEDPDLNPDAQQSDDEDVPLGLLVAKKQAGGNGDISAVAAELNRPLGLMERRDMEENEPLSRRRARLQGRDVPAPVSMYLNSAGAGGPTRQSALNLAPSMSALNLADRSPRLVEPDDDDDVEGETLGERMRRLRAQDEAENPLPRTRPVSGAFSVELLSQFGGGGDEDDAKSKADVKGKAKVVRAPPEEEETLGQRRRRLQAEREAREREMAAGGVGGAAVNLGALNALNGNAAVEPGGRLSRRLSLADVLSANPLDSARGAIDPREQERLRREEEAARAQRLKDEQMRLYRAQMPATLRDPTAGMNKAGGYLGGRFNDGNAGGSGGGVGLGLRPSASMGTLNGQMRNASGGSGYYPQAQAQGQQQQQQYAYGGLPQQQYPQQYQQQQPMMNMGMGMGMGGYAHQPYGTMTMTGAYGNGYAGGMPMPMQMQMPMNMGMQHTQGQLDMVERWRQSIMP